MQENVCQRIMIGFWFCPSFGAKKVGKHTVYLTQSTRKVIKTKERAKYKLSLVLDPDELNFLSGSFTRGAGMVQL